MTKVAERVGWVRHWQSFPAGRALDKDRGASAPDRGQRVRYCRCACAKRRRSCGVQLQPTLRPGSHFAVAQSRLARLKRCELPKPESPERPCDVVLATNVRG